MTAGTHPSWRAAGATLTLAGALACADRKTLPEPAPSTAAPPAPAPAPPLDVGKGDAPTLSAGIDPRGPEATSLLGRPLFALPEGPETLALEENLRRARDAMAQHPDDPEAIVWVGRRLGYLWRMREAIEVFTEGLARFPDHPALLRHRGHRYISIRQFDRAIADLERATVAIEGLPDAIEPDGAPNERNIPLTTTGFNVWYHLALARYLKGDFQPAAADWRRAMEHTRALDDNVVAVSDWLYMSLRRIGDQEGAALVLAPIRQNMDIIENRSYHRRLLLYKGVINPEDLMRPPGAQDDQESETLDLATLGYGLGNWYYYNGDTARALEIMKQVVDRGYWPAFSTLAAEADLARLAQGGDRR